MNKKFSSVLTIFIIQLQAMAALGMEPSEQAIKKYRQRQAQATPESVLSWMLEGNQRFANGKSIHGGYPINITERRKISAISQRPLAVVLSCIDSRTTPEAIFDTSIGDLFTTRVGGNVINDDILGSLEISVASGVKVVMVLGHTDCGGVKAACNNVEFEHMTQLLARIKKAVTLAHAKLDKDPILSAKIGERVTENRAYVAFVSHMNAKESVRKILERSSYLRTASLAGEILLLPALYNVDTGQVIIGP